MGLQYIQYRPISHEIEKGYYVAWFLIGPTVSLPPSMTSLVVGSAVFARLTRVTDRQSKTCVELS